MRKNVSYTLLAFLLCLGALALTGCSGGEEPSTGGNGEADGSDVIKIGVAGPFTGSGSVYGEMIWGAATLASYELNNEQGGIEVDGKKYKVEFVKGDDQSKNDQAQVVANQFATDPDICLVIGHFNSSCSLAGKPIYNEHEVVSLSPGSTNVKVCEGGPYTFRNLYRDDYQGEFLADFAKAELGAKKVGVFYDNDDYGIGLKDAFVRKAGQIGLEISSEEAYTRELTLDFSSGADKFAAADLDAIFIAGLYEAAAMIVKTLRAKGIDVPVLAGDGVDSPGLIEGAGAAADGVIVTSPFVFTEDNEVAGAFQQKFAQIVGKAPDTWAALTYDAIMMSVDGIEEVGPNRKKLRDWLAKHDSAENGWNGITGNTYFDANGDCLKPAYTKVVKDGAFVVYESK